MKEKNISLVTENNPPLMTEISFLSLQQKKKVIIISFSSHSSFLFLILTSLTEKNCKMKKTLTTIKEHLVFNKP